MPQHSRTFDAIGTSWTILTEAPLADPLYNQLLTRIELFDRTYSRFRPDSLVASLQKSAGRYEFPADGDPLISFYYQLYHITSGAATPLIGHALEQAGYDSSYSFVSRNQTPLPTWEDALIWQPPYLTTTQPLSLDFGAAGKGYLVDIISCLLESAGVDDYLVDASGDMRRRGKGAAQIGLEDPRDPNKVIGVVPLTQGSLCASATNRRRWGNGQHHIFDPQLRAPTQAITATWVIADSTLLADGLATALFFTPPQTLAEHFDFAYVRMHSDSTLDYSAQFEGQLFA